MIIRFIFYLTSVCASLIVALDYPDYPEGYYPFEQTPTKNPPRVRRPPYLQGDAVCPGIQETIEVAAQSLQNLCGNLNEGFLPINPLGQKVKGQTYPFDLIRNSTLRFFSKTLPVLKKDETLPRVAKYMNPKLSSGKNRNLDTMQRKKFEVPKSQYYKNRIWKREVTDTTNTSSNFDSHLRTSSVTGFQGRSSRQFYQPSAKKDSTTDDQTIGRRAIKMVKKIGRGARSFCHNNWGFLCLIYNYVSGSNNDAYPIPNRREDGFSRNAVKDETLLPMTPCPSAVEYVTPVFARNYQGVWRYVVQIPYEGYFTQTVEITQCLSTKCHYLSGSCLSSPRWVSLLVAEIFYPDALFPIVSQKLQKIRAPSLNHRPPPPHPTSSRQRPRFASSRESVEDTNENKHCDGSDNIGCFQVRLYYDWFLVPGSCKCWKQDYQAQFALRHRH